MSYLDILYKQSGFKSGDYTHLLVDYLVKEKMGLDLQTLGFSPKRTLLDVGSGKGYQAAAFARYFRVTCLDRIADFQQVVDEFGVDMTGVTCDLESDRYPCPDGEFSVVFSKSVIEHLSAWEHFLAQCKRVLASDGTLILMTPSWRSQWKNFFDDPTHVRPFTPKGLRVALKMAGFDEVAVEEVYQLPFVWRFWVLRWIPKLVALAPDSWKWRDEEQLRHRTIVRFSKEKMLLAVAKK